MYKDLLHLSQFVDQCNKNFYMTLPHDGKAEDEHEADYIESDSDSEPKTHSETDLG